jgi:hypothetical protein
MLRPTLILLTRARNIFEFSQVANGNNSCSYEIWCLETIAQQADPMNTNWFAKQNDPKWNNDSFFRTCVLEVLMVRILDACRERGGLVLVFFTSST